MPTRQDAKNKKKNKKMMDQWMIERYERGHRYWTEYRVEGKLPLHRGRRFRVQGVSGWWVFTYAGKDKGGDYLECYGPFTKNSTRSSGSSHSFCPTRVLKVERRIWAPPQPDAVETNGERAERLGLNNRKGN